MSLLSYCCLELISCINKGAGGAPPVLEHTRKGTEGDFSFNEFLSNITRLLIALQIVIFYLFLFFWGGVQLGSFPLIHISSILVVIWSYNEN